MSVFPVYTWLEIYVSRFFREDSMGIIAIDGTNIDEEHICCAIGNDKENRARARTKKDWLKAQFAEGLIFKRLDERGKVFAEYMPVEKVWKPLVGENWMVINCLWVSGQFKGKGYGAQLLEECVKDAKKLKMDGVAVVSSSTVKPFLTDKKFYLEHGFEVIDSAAPYFELLALKFNKKAVDPKFTQKAKKAECDSQDGFTFIYSNQCVFMEEYVALLESVAREMKFNCVTLKLKSAEDARKNGSPFGTLGIYYQGRFVTHELMTADKFRRLIAEKTGGRQSI
jgi:GNAT superfamily N-acetyltransferase